MIEKSIPHFSLSQICQSGQCFRMRPLEPVSPQKERFLILAGSRRLEAEQQGQVCLFHCEEKDFEKFWSRYFDLETDYRIYRDQIDPKDEFLTYAARMGWGIRILYQDLWEMIVSFLISQQNHIGRIRKCVENICIQYGEPIEPSKRSSLKAFPTPQALAPLEEDDLMACNLGYRSKYVVRAARSVVCGHIDLKQLQLLPYEEARNELLKLYGVGEKVADCICLFALHKLEAFPVDTHIRQALESHYPHGFPPAYKKIQGILQQYIFYHELMKDHSLCPVDKKS